MYIEDLAHWLGPQTYLSIKDYDLLYFMVLTVCIGPENEYVWVCTFWLWGGEDYCKGFEGYRQCLSGWLRDINFLPFCKIPSLHLSVIFHRWLLYDNFDNPQVVFSDRYGFPDVLAAGSRKYLLSFLEPIKFLASGNQFYISQPFLTFRKSILTPRCLTRFKQNIIFDAEFWPS